MTDRKRDGIIAIVSGAVTALSGVVMIAVPVDPVWVAPLTAVIGAVMTVLFGVKAVKA